MKNTKNHTAKDIVISHIAAFDEETKDPAVIALWQAHLAIDNDLEQYLAFEETDKALHGPLVVIEDYFSDQAAGDERKETATGGAMATAERVSA